MSSKNAIPRARWANLRPRNVHEMSCCTRICLTAEISLTLTTVWNSYAYRPSFFAAGLVVTIIQPDNHAASALPN
jgi:hypothetical protein